MQLDRLAVRYDHYSGRTAPLNSKRFILYIYSTNIGTEYFQHDIYSPFLSLQNAVCFTILTDFVPVLFTFYLQDVLKLKKKNNSVAKSLTDFISWSCLFSMGQASTSNLYQLVFEASRSHTIRHTLTHSHTR